MLPLAEGSVAEATATASETIEDTASEDASTADTRAGEQKQSDEDGMASSAERMAILRMVETGKISAEEGARLLAALNKGQEAESSPRSSVFESARQLHVRVTDLATNRQKVNVTVPAGLFKLIWRWLPVSVQTDLEQVQVAINSGESGRLVEVVDQDSGVRVEITLI